MTPHCSYNLHALSYRTCRTHHGQENMNMYHEYILIKYMYHGMLIVVLIVYIKIYELS